jgi:hypothetical protein
VKKINVADFYEMKQVGTPGQSMVKMFHVACLMMNDMMKVGRPKKPTDDKKKQYDPDGWFDLGKSKLLANPKQFLQNMIEYDKDHIPDALVVSVRTMMENEEAL